MKSERLVKCLLCGQEAKLKHKEYRGYQEPATFRIYHCGFCNTAFSVPRIEDSTALYDHIYNNGPLVPEYDRYYKHAECVKNHPAPLDYLAETEDTYWGVRAALSKFINDKQSARILEVGSGLGYLTYALNKAEYDVSGLDLSKVAIRKATETYGDYYICDNLFNFSELSPNTFDLLIITEVIEHVNEPLGILKAMLKLLKPGGHIVLTTPNKSFFSNDIAWFSSSPPVHCWWFSEDSFIYIADSLNVGCDFLDWSDYYGKQNRTIRPSDIKKDQNPSPTLDKNGQLIPKKKSEGAPPQKKPFTSGARTVLKRPAPVRLLTRIYTKLVSLIIRFHLHLENYIHPPFVCGKRGPVICAFLTKK